MSCIYISLLSILLFSSCSDNNKDADNTTKQKTLMEYVMASDIQGVRNSVKNGIDVDRTNDIGETPLLKATQMNQITIAEILLKAGADINKQDNIYDSPFLYASAEGRTEILQMMLDYNPNVKIYNRYGGNGLIPAAEKGHLENVTLLLEKTDMDVNHINNLGWTALLEAIILTDGGKVYQDIIKVLIAHGANVNLPDKEGITPLAHARKKRYTEIERILLAAGAHE